MGVTSNGLPYPENSDFVADGAMAIKDLADNVNAKAGLWKVIPSGATNGTVGANGDVAVGSAVSTVTVSGAFSSKYENYLITVTGGAGSAVSHIRIRFGSTTSGYYFGIVYGTGYGSGAIGIGNAGATTTGSHIERCGYASSNGINAKIDVLSPQLAKRTAVMAMYAPDATNEIFGTMTGVVPNNTQYTSFEISPSTGTLTGGTIRVYGYN